MRSFHSPRWSDNDVRYGPFTYSSDRGKSYRRIGVEITSGDREYPGCVLRLFLYAGTLLVGLPQAVLKPHVTRVKATYWSAEDIARIGRDWYPEVHARSYGIHYAERSLHIHYGPQTLDSGTSKSRVFFIPWLEWRQVRHSIYTPEGGLFANLSGIDNWQAQEILRDACPVQRFRFADIDGEEIVATCRLEERERKLGTSWCKWLSLFRRAKVSRALNLRFSAEVGPQKGSWKGGTVGHGIEMKPGETVTDAFRRYCDQQKLKFIGVELAEATSNSEGPE
jgi:hypothetical protein